MMNREVRRIMNTNPDVALMTESAQAIIDKMIGDGLQQLPVITDEGKLAGMIHYHTMLSMQQQHKDISALTAADCMDERVLKITPKDKVGTAAELFADQRFKVLPVVNLRNELKGVVTAFNLIKLAFNKEYSSPILYKDAFVA